MALNIEFLYILSSYELFVIVYIKVIVVKLLTLYSVSSFSYSWHGKEQYEINCYICNTFYNPLWHVGLCYCLISQLFQQQKYLPTPQNDGALCHEK